jgi:hypothetical protein
MAAASGLYVAAMQTHESCSLSLLPEIHSCRDANNVSPSATDEEKSIVHLSFFKILHK